MKDAAFINVFVCTELQKCIKVYKIITHLLHASPNGKENVLTIHTQKCMSMVYVFPSGSSSSSF